LFDLAISILLRIIQDLEFTVPDARTQEMFYDLWAQLTEAEDDPEKGFLQQVIRFFF